MTAGVEIAKKNVRLSPVHTGGCHNPLPAGRPGRGVRIVGYVQPGEMQVGLGQPCVDPPGAQPVRVGSGPGQAFDREP